MCAFLCGIIMQWTGFPKFFNFGGDVTIEFISCAILGAILSATDPVSVISLFKSLGTEKKISILIEGESMLNDGSAVVVLEILIVILVSMLGHSSDHHTPSELIWISCKLALGGPFIGFLWA